MIYFNRILSRAKWDEMTVVDVEELKLIVKVKRDAARQGGRGIGCSGENGNQDMITKE